MRNCWIWSVCLLLGGALSANAALIVGTGQTATVTQGNLIVTYDVGLGGGGTYDIVTIKMVPTGTFAGATLNGFEGRFTTVGGKMFTPIGDPHSTADHLDGDGQPDGLKVGEWWVGQTVLGRTTGVTPPSSYVGLPTVQASTIPGALNQNFNRNLVDTNTTDFIEGTWSGTVTNYSTFVMAKLYVPVSTTNITFGTNGFTGLSKIGYSIAGSGYTDPVQFSLVPVPEPGTMALLLTGGLALAGFGWRRRK